MIFDLYRCRFTTHWKDLHDHPHVHMLTHIIKAIDKRTAQTTLVKVKAHVGQLLNEEADQLAGLGCTQEHTPHEPFYSTRTPAMTVSLWPEPLKDKEPEILPLRKIIPHICNKDRTELLANRLTATPDAPVLLKITAPGVGRDFLARIIRGDKLDAQQSRRMIQYMTCRIPTNSYLSHFTNQHPDCDLCKQARETICHLQCLCPKLEEARCKVHNDGFNVVWSHINKHMPKGKWEGAREKSIQNIPNLIIPPIHARRRPDAYLYKNNTLLMLDYTRGHGRTKQDLDTRREEKEQQYKDMLLDLKNKNPTWTIELIVLHVSYGAAIDIEHWNTQIEKILDPETNSKTLDSLIEQVIIQTSTSFSEMIDIRNIAVANQREKDKQKVDTP